MIQQEATVPAISCHHCGHMDQEPFLLMHAQSHRASSLFLVNLHQG
jgi:hypothetical protein